MKIGAKSYVLNLFEKEKKTFLSTIIRTELWHKIFCHFHHAGVLYMQNHALVKGVSSLEEKDNDGVFIYHKTRT